MIAPLLLSALLGAAQATGTMSPTSDVSGNRVKATGSTTPRALKDIAADVVNVKDFGAVGDGTTDDTVAIQSAVTSAGRTYANAQGGSQYGHGGTVFFPGGVYRTTAEIVVGQGVSIVGSGRFTTQIRVTANASTDGVSWKWLAAGYGHGGSLRDIAIVADSTTTVRDLVSLVQWSAFEIANTQIGGAGRYGLSITDTSDIDVRDSVIGGNTSAGAWVGTAGASIATTTRFSRVYFSGTTNGPGADVAGLHIDFNQCIFESNGVNDAVNGVGLRVRSGTVAVAAPYAENNKGHALHLGSTGPTYASVIDPSFQNGPYTDTSKAGIYADNVTAGAFLGGNFSALTHTVVFTANSANVLVMGQRFGPNLPEIEGGDIRNFPGVVYYENPSTGNRYLTGAVAGVTTAGVLARPGGTLTMTADSAAGSSVDDFVVNTSTTRTSGNLFAIKNAGTKKFWVTSSGYIGATADLSMQTADRGISITGNLTGANASADVTLGSTATRTAGRLFRWVNAASILGGISYEGFPDFAGHRMEWAASAPAAGTWSQGDVVWNTGAAAGVAPGWVCTSAGTPGTWKAMANLAP